jgi:hypothetical protein
LIRRIRKEKEQGTTPGGEQALVLHPQQHDRGCISPDYRYFVQVETFIFRSFAGHFDSLFGCILSYTRRRRLTVASVSLNLSCVYMDVDDLVVLYLTMQSLLSTIDGPPMP